ncbi:hypothetical protein [Thiohalocapsa sp.]|nr:hypothetical protein [Thiohalocapsa sp.]
MFVAQLFSDIQNLAEAAWAAPDQGAAWALAAGFKWHGKFR